MLKFHTHKGKILLCAGALALAVGALPPVTYSVAYATADTPTEAEIDAYMNELVNLSYDAVKSVMEQGTALSAPDIKQQVQAAIWRLGKERGFTDLTEEMVSDLADGIIGVAWEVFPSGTLTDSGAGACNAPADGSGCTGDNGMAGNAPATGNGTSGNNPAAGNGTSAQPVGQFSDYAQAVLEEVNRNRQEHGVAPLILAEDLCYGADIRAQEIVSVFSHTRPDGSACYSVIQGSYRKAAENIATGHATAQETVEQWMNSPGHRANILDPELRELGVGYCQAPDSEYGHYWVQLFRTR